MSPTHSAATSGAPRVFTPEVGQAVFWCPVVSNYGHTRRYRATVVRVGKRVTLRVAHRPRLVVAHFVNLEPDPEGATV